MKTRFKVTLSILMTFILLIAALLTGLMPGAQQVLAETVGSILFLYPNWFYDGVEAGENLGSAVSTAGDINGDGFADVLVGAQKSTLHQYREGVAFLFFNNHGSLSILPDWKIGGGQQGSLFGCTLSDLGDVNQDGYDDLIIGACDYNLIEEGVVVKSKVGAAFVYYGSKYFTAKTSADWTLLGDQVDGKLGSSVNTAGDINKDGFADVIIGEPFYDENEDTNIGKAYIFFGSASGLNTSPGWTATGNAKSELFGSAVANAGDVNGDGRQDIIVGAPRPGSSTSLQIGYAYAFYNSSSGLSTTPSWSVTNGQTGAWFGATVTGVGDINKDGFDDVLIGAPYTKQLINGAPEAVGCAYLYLGSKNGLTSAPAWTYCSDQAGGKFGASVDSVGDMNQDGFPDFLVGMPFYSVSNEHQGAVFLFFGSTSGVKSDSFEATYGNKADTEFGAALGGIGDVNADGRKDIIVGSPNFKTSIDRVGRAMIYYAGIPGEPDFQIFPVYLPLVSTGN